MRLTLALLTLSLLAGCAHPPAGKGTLGARGPTAAISRDGAAGHSELLLHALGMVGVPYRYGGDSPDTGFDCSGLVKYLYGAVLGVDLPRRAQEMSRVGNAIGPDELSPGDLVFFDTLREPFSHVGIYLGDRRFIHAPSRGGQVEVVSMSGRYWRQRYNGARRITF